MLFLNNLSTVPPPDPSYSPQDGSQIAFYIGNIPIAWYGIFMCLAILSAIAVICFKMWKIYKLPLDVFYYYCLIGIPSSILGARIWSCAIGDATWSNFFDIKQGGLAIQGGVILTVIVGMIYFLLILRLPKFQIRDDEFGEKPAVRRVSIWVYADCIVPAILLGQVIGRWGNYFNQELYGSIINDNDSLCWFLRTVLPKMYIDGNYRQPLFLWEMLINLCGFLLLFIVCDIPKKFRKAGDLAILYFLWYGIVRLCLEPLRNTQFSFANTYIISILWVVFASILLILNHILFARTRDFKIWTMIIELHIFFPIVLWKILINSKKTLQDNKFKKYIRKDNEKLFYRGL